MKVPFLRSAYNYDTNQVSDETGLRCMDPSLTQQQFAEEADINTIVDRFLRSGVMPTPTQMPQYVDYEGVFDFQSAMNVVRSADENFMRLDAKVRSRLTTLLKSFLSFLQIPRILRRLSVWGWLSPKLPLLSRKRQKRSRRLRRNDVMMGTVRYLM